jgi:hypothetical protein
MIAYRTTNVRVQLRNSRDRFSPFPCLIQSIDSEKTDPTSLSDPGELAKLFINMKTGRVDRRWELSFTGARCSPGQVVRVLSWVDMELGNAAGWCGELACGLFQLRDGRYLFLYTEITGNTNPSVPPGSTVKFSLADNLSVMLEKIKKYPDPQLWVLLRHGAYGGLDRMVAQALTQELEA